MSRLIEAAQAVPPLVRATLRARRYRRWVLLIAAGYVLVYLLAIQNLIITGRDLSRFVSIPSVQVSADWPSRWLEPIAAFYYEPIVAIRPINHVTFLVSPVNLAIGLLLAGLVGVSVSAALYARRLQGPACRTRGVGGVVAALPGFLTGFACCVPTVALALGAQFALAVVAVRSWFVPAAVVALLGSMLWTGSRLSAGRDATTPTPRPSSPAVSAPPRRDRATTTDAGR
jgi:hypothetical protein